MVKVLQRLLGCTVFSTVDLVRTNESQLPRASFPKKAVTTPFGLFELIGMPPSLRNAVQSFHKFVENLLRDLLFVGCYIDDIILFSSIH